LGCCPTNCKVDRRNEAATKGIKNIVLKLLRTISTLKISFFFFCYTITTLRLFIKIEGVNIILNIRGRGRRTKFRLTLLGGMTPLENYVELSGLRIPVRNFLESQHRKE
jgi:hypothetical protein